MPKFVIVDTRDLEPPEPLERVMAAIHSHTGQTVICMRHRLEPCKLFSIVEKLGFSHHMERLADDFYQILIWRKDDAATLRALEQSHFQVEE